MPKQPLALPFAKPRKNRDSRTLSLVFGDKSAPPPIVPPPPPKPPEPPKPKRRTVALDCAGHISGSLGTAHCQTQPQSAQKAAAVCIDVAGMPLYTVAGCFALHEKRNLPLDRCHIGQSGAATELSKCRNIGQAAALPRAGCAETGNAAGLAYRTCAAMQQSSLHFLWHCAAMKTQSRSRKTACAGTAQSAAREAHGCQILRHSRSVVPPCEWYPIPLPPAPPPAEKRKCGSLPPSRHLPLPFRRRKLRRDGRQLPFNFTCNQKQVLIPALDSYMIVNKIKAEADGKPLELLSAELSADTDGHYWSGSFTLPPDDFARLNLDSRHDDCIIRLDLNGEIFDVMAESYSDNRRFGQRSYTVTGRSRTAKLGADYALSHKGIISQDRNARQIADEAVQMTGVSLDWQIDDWLVPADVYSLTDKTPMAVLADIAQAAGAFVESHPADMQIAIKSRWPTAAWELGNAAAALAVPANMMIQAGGQKQVQQQANGVFVWGEHSKGFAADVWRNGSNREPRAAARTHPLYTAQEVCRMAGIAALSETGTHKTETVVLPVAPQYALPRAQLGRVWRFDEPNGAWQGIIIGVKIEISHENGAPKVLQSVRLDRYLGE
nr:hypothetical protein [Neisseria meningitidis]